MAVKSISVWCAGLFAVGITVWLGGQSTSAYELSPTGTPNSSVVGAPTAVTPALAATLGQPLATQANYQPPVYPDARYQAQVVPTPANSQRRAYPIPMNSQPQPMPTNGQPLPTPTNSQPQPMPANGQPQVYPIPANDQPQATPSQQASEDCEEEGCASFCGEPVCSPPGRFWLRAEYLGWWTSGTRLPPLVTTAPQGESPNLDNPNTTILYGDQTVGTNMRSGFRTTIGMWLDNCHRWGLELDYFSLGEQADGYSNFSNGDPVTGRPFFNVYTNAQAAELVASTDIVRGTVGVEVGSYFQSAGLTVSRNLCHGCGSCGDCDECDTCDGPCSGTCGVPLLNCCRTDLLFGVRYYDLSDRVGITEDLLVTESSSPHFGTTYAISDNFRTRNEFAGGEIGLRTQIYRGRWSFDILTKIAVGNTHQTVTIGGTTVITPLGESPEKIYNGILAVGSNSGSYQRDVFTMIPHLSTQVGYQINRHWKATLGYDILYWGAVTRAGDQIDLNVDPRNWPSGLSPSPTNGLPFPAFSGRQSSFWAQGISVGTEFRF